MELFEEIRREYEFGAGSIQGVARKLGVHRRLVREALSSAVPVRKPAPKRKRPRVGPVMDFIDAILEEDREAPRKQRHTAHRIYVRLCQERPNWAVSESSVRKYVRGRKLALGLVARETFVPQHYNWGGEAQVDWYEADAELGGERLTLQVYVMRSMASGGAFHRAYLHATQQAFLEAHEHAFQYFGGVFQRLRYDNLSSAVKRILRGSRREETARFVAFRSHWRFSSEFCTPGEGHEKGGVEAEVGTFRRNHWVPVPKARDLAELNAQLLQGCHADAVRTVTGHEQTVGAGMLLEREHLLPLAEEGFDLAEASFPTVNTLGCVKVRTNAYSCPVRAGTTVQAKLSAATVEVWHEGHCVAKHQRCYGRYQEVMDLEHNLDVLEHKPGALAGSKRLEQWRKLGRWPASYDLLWHGLMQRYGKQEGTKEMILLLQLARTHGQQRLQGAIEATLALGCQDSAAVRHLLAAAQLERMPVAPLQLGLLARFDRPMPKVTDYDRLLVGGRATMSVATESLQQSTVAQYCKLLRLPTVAGQCSQLAEQAEREHHTYLAYLEALLIAEVEERERRVVGRRLMEGHLPRIKTLDEFDFSQTPSVSAANIAMLAEGGYIERAEPVVFIGDSGTGKTHLLTGLCVAACRQKRRVRFTTAANLVNELVEAKQQLQLRRVLARWSRYDVIAIDEVGYVPLAEVGAEFLFQVVAERAEKAAVILTTNLPFSEWTQVLPNARLCKALLDRITDHAHIIETGTESYRFRRTMDRRRRKG